MVPCSGDTELSAAEIANHLADAWPSLPAIDDPKDSDSTSSFSVSSADVILGQMSVAIPWSELEGPCSVATLWPDAEHELCDHSAHIIVTVSADADEIAMATLLTQVTSSLLAVNKQALGVYWGSATKLIRRDIFMDFTKEILPCGPPMHLWVDYRVGIDGDNTVSGFTTGMKALGHKELEAHRVSESPGELMDRMLALGQYLVLNGPVIGDGDTIGEDANERIRVVYSDSLFGHPQKIMRLVY